MKVALVHDYLKEYGGAERVLEVLSEIFPEAPIYTAFYKKNSVAYQRLKNRKIIPSWVHYIPFFATKLHSPLRFLAPFIWGSFNFSKYDVVISSASWYVTKGIQKGSKTIEICYCHTPPRWLYGYRTSIEWQKFWPIKVYGTIVGHFMRLYDFQAAQRVDYFIANSEEVKQRIKKFYKRDATVIYPPVELPKNWEVGNENVDTELGSGKSHLSLQSEAIPAIRPELRPRASHVSPLTSKGDYYFIVSRIVGSKGLDLAVEAATKLGFKLKIAGATSGYYTEHKKLAESAKDNVEFLGFITDEELARLYVKAKAFLAMSQDEDFGITPVEAMSFGTPVIAYNGGGYKETVIEGKTGIFFNEHSVNSLIDAIRKFEKLSIKPEDCIKQAQKFSKEIFKKKILDFVNKYA